MAATRTHKHHAHFFTLFDSKTQGRLDALSRHKLCGTNARSCLAAPRCGAQGHPSWTQGNPSMYLVDIGLRAACRESRAAAKKAWGEPTCSESCTGCDACDYDSDSSDDDSSRISRVPRTTRFTSDDGQQQVMMVRPRIDLFCLQPHSWEGLKDIRLNHTSIFPLHGSRYLGHVAFELPRYGHMNVPGLRPGQQDPQPWTHPMVKHFARFFIHGGIADAERVWLIDYGLRRNGPDPNGPGARRPFEFWANGLKFVEVMGYGRWTDDRDGGRSALQYVEWLVARSRRYHDGELGVLACEDVLGGQADTRPAYIQR